MYKSRGKRTDDEKTRKVVKCTELFPRSRENLSTARGGRDFGRDSLGLRDGSEMVVSDSCVKGKLVVLFWQ